MARHLPGFAPPLSGRRRQAPATQRNRDPILAVLKRVFPKTGTVLEIASGTGEHAVYFARAFPALVWQPTDADPEMRDSIAAWMDGENLPNLRPPLALDVGDAWPVARADAVVCINMIHIAPWQATLDLVAGATRVLPPDGVLFLYGPYRRFGTHTAPSNEAFDARLRSENPAWGVRDMEAVAEAAASQGIEFEEAVPMPANNFSVVLRKRPG